MRTGLWIPVEVEALSLSPTEKYIMAEIVSLDRVGECFASNEHFSKLIGIRPDSVSRIISKLKKQGLLKQTGFDGRKRKLSPILSTKSETNFSPSLTPILAEKSTQKREQSKSRVGSNAEAAYASKQSPIKRVQLNTNVQNSWEEFLKWSRGKVSESTWNLISKTQRPEELSGAVSNIWKRWSVI